MENILLPTMNIKPMHITMKSLSTDTQCIQFMKNTLIQFTSKNTTVSN